ncbi:MAG: ubiquinol-cytochrome C chaperone [Alphaproteobacteria bacterium]|nr:ubiquinol-cytochrome C chaperone [Alphaproteobacteria bacterium]
MLRKWFSRPAEEAAAVALYRAAVAQARQPGFYTSLGVPDTVDGRFEMVALHAFLVLHRLKGEGEAGQRLGQAVFDAMFADMDHNLREMGAGDLGVGPRVKTMAKAFYGRIAAYEAGLAQGDVELRAALRRNVFRTRSDIDEVATAAVAAYLKREAEQLARQPVEKLMAGELQFGAPPAS